MKQSDTPRTTLPVRYQLLRDALGVAYPSIDDPSREVYIEYLDDIWRQNNELRAKLEAANERGENLHAKWRETEAAAAKVREEPVRLLDEILNEVRKYRAEMEVNTELLIDIREELRTLNRLLHCPNFLAIPGSLRRISANTRKPKKRKP